MRDEPKLQSRFHAISHALLRFGLGLTFLYAGAEIFAYPEDWLTFVPSWIGSFVPLHTFLLLHAGMNILLGALFIANILTHWMALFAALDFFAILAFAGIDSVTFRDFGLLMAALALFFESDGVKKIHPHAED